MNVQKEGGESSVIDEDVGDDDGIGRRRMKRGRVTKQQDYAGDEKLTLHEREAE